MNYTEEEEYAALRQRPEPPPINGHVMKTGGKVEIKPTKPRTDSPEDIAAAIEADIYLTYYRIMMDASEPSSVRKSCADALLKMREAKRSVEVG